MEKIIELVLNDDEIEQICVYALGIVKYPAIESNFIYFSDATKQETSQNHYFFSKEKHMLYGPAMIPNKKILQYDENGNEYFVFFSKDTIEKLAKNFMKNYNQKNFTFEHESYVDGALLTEQWIIEDGLRDKSAYYGFNLPSGTWMVGVYITNLELWEKVKNDSVRGFSIEAFMNEKIKNSLKNIDKSDDEKLLIELQSLFNSEKLDKNNIDNI